MKKDIQGDVAMGPKRRMSHKAVREHAVKACGRVEVRLNSFLTSAIDESCNSTPRPLYSRERTLVHNK